MSIMEEGPRPNVLTLLTRELGRPPTRQEAVEAIAALADHTANLYKAPEDASEKVKMEAIKTSFLTDKPNKRQVVQTIFALLPFLGEKEGEEVHQKVTSMLNLTRRMQSAGPGIRVS